MSSLIDSLSKISTTKRLKTVRFVENLVRIVLQRKKANLHHCAMSVHLGP